MQTCAKRVAQTVKANFDDGAFAVRAGAGLVQGDSARFEMPLNHVRYHVCPVNIQRGHFRQNIFAAFIQRRY